MRKKVIEFSDYEFDYMEWQEKYWSQEEKPKFLRQLNPKQAPR